MREERDGLGFGKSSKEVKRKRREDGSAHNSYRKSKAPVFAHLRA